jgi:pimeloyl-ACP methyl ester carboxylesterase
MIDSRLRFLAPLALLMAFGSIGATSAQEEEPPPQPVFPALPADAPAGSGMMQPCLEHLDGSVRCGRYRVWENREARTGRTLDLAFLVADALDPQADETSAITYFFGGPGSSVTSAAAFVIADSSELRQHRDLLFLDFRGVGASGALDCGVPYPGGIQSRFGAIFPLDQILACRDRLRERAQLDQYTTDHNMDDLDELRAWLNYRTLDLDGGSYGTREIQVFLRRHPTSARTVIMNAVAPIFERGYLTHAKALQTALDELVAECLHDASCGAAYPDLEATVGSVLERVATDPPEVTAEGETVRLGRGELGYALRGLLYGRAGEIPALIAGAAKGDWQPLADYYVQRSGWVSDPEGEAGMHFSVLCAEDIARVDDEMIAKETAGTFLGDYLIGGYKRVCDNWPYARLDPSFWEPVASDVPALLFSGGRDPVTPPAGGEAVARYLSNSLHVVVPGSGHGAFGPCIGQIQQQFIESGTVDGLDTSCVEARPPTEFVLPETEE